MTIQSTIIITEKVANYYNECELLEKEREREEGGGGGSMQAVLCGIKQFLSQIILSYKERLKPQLDFHGSLMTEPFADTVNTPSMVDKSFKI